MAHVGKVTRASDGRLVFYGTDELDRTRVVSFPAGARYLDRLGHTLVRETTGHEGEPWWGEFPDHRRPGKDEWVGWDESAEEGPDEGPPYVGAGSGVPYDRYHDNPATGPYPGWPPTRAEPDPRDLEPSATWHAVRRTAAASPNALLGLSGPGGYRTRETKGYDLGCQSCTRGLGGLGVTSNPINWPWLVVGALAGVGIGWVVWKDSR